MDECPPPLNDVHAEDEYHNTEAEAPFSNSSELFCLKIPSSSRSPSPKPPANGNPHIAIDEVVHGASSSAASSPVSNGGIESFMERNEVDEDCLPVHSIGLSPTPSRDATPIPEQMAVLDQTDDVPVDEVKDDDDDFGDFGEAPSHVEGTQDTSDIALREGSSQSLSASGNWDAFKSQAAEEAAKEEDEWATFESAPMKERIDEQGMSTHQQVQEPMQDDVDDYNELCEMEDAWLCMEEEESDVPEDDAFDLYHHLNEEKGGSEEGQQALPRACSLWLAVRVVEEAHALKHVWNASSSALKLLALLGIHEHTTLRGDFSTSALAPNVVLTPTPVTLPSSSSRQSGASSLSPVSSGPSTTVRNGEDGDTARMPPPATFEWDESTLNKPQAGWAMSSSDADFLSNGGSAPPRIISSTTNLERDLADFGLSATTASASAALPSTASSPQTVLDSLMSSSSTAHRSTRYTSPSELSLDAKALHDALPHFDHLSASWITFPVKHGE